MKEVWIVAPAGNGDVGCSTCLLPYKDKLWPHHKLIWFVHPHCQDMLAHNDKIDEVRLGKPSSQSSDGILKFSTTPYGNKLVKQNIPLAFIPKHTVGAPTIDEWHPYLCFTEQEDENADRFMSGLPEGRLNVMMETFCKSGQSNWTQNDTRVVMNICRKEGGACNFLFASKAGFAKSRHPITGLDKKDVFYCGDDFTIRQIIPVFNRCHLFIGISSGLSVATCAWQALPDVRRVEYVYHRRFSSSAYMARGPWSMSTNKSKFFQLLRTAVVEVKREIR